MTLFLSVFPGCRARNVFFGQVSLFFGHAETFVKLVVFFALSFANSPCSQETVDAAYCKVE